MTPQGAVVANAGPDQTGVVRNTKVTLSGAGSTVTGATYTWTQLVTGTSNPMPAGVDKVTLSPVTGQPRDATFTLPFYKYPMTNAPLTFRLTVTVGGTTKTDDVVIVPRSDTVTITSAKFKVGDFRVIGTSSTVGATMTMRSATGTVWGTAPVIVGGTYDIRNRTGSPATNPGMVYVDSNMGGTAGPFPIAQG